MKEQQAMARDDRDRPTYGFREKELSEYDKEQMYAENRRRLHEKFLRLSPKDVVDRYCQFTERATMNMVSDIQDYEIGAESRIKSVAEDIIENLERLKRLVR
jgi:hypothetical protein